MPAQTIASTHEFGFVTIATGPPSYSEMAVDFALSLRKFHDHPICLLGDAKSIAYVQKNYPDTFGIYAQLTPRYKHTKTTKFALAELVPFETAVFIDADTIVLGSLDILIKQAALKNFFMMGSFLPRDSTKTHHGIRVGLLMEEFGLDSFFTSHSAAFGYHRDYATSFLNDCYHIYVDGISKLKWRRQGFLGDELAFGIAAARNGMNIMEEPFPVLWSHELACLKPGAATKPLCHFHTCPSDEALNWLMSGVNKTRRNAGYRENSESAWRAKAKQTIHRKSIGGVFKNIGRYFAGKSGFG